MCYNMCLENFVALQGGREQWNTGPPVTCCAICRQSPTSLRGATQLSSKMEEDSQQGQQPQPGQGEIQILETPTRVDTDAGVEKNAIEASQGIPTIDATHTSTPEWPVGIPDLDLPVDEGGDVGESVSPLRGFRGRWMSRDKNLPEDVGEVELFDEATGGTPSLDWEADSVPANPEPPTGVIVDEHDAKVIANHIFLSNAKWSSISLPWESGFMKNIFGEDVVGLTSDLRQDASWIEAVTHVPVSTIAADSSNPTSFGPELQPAFAKCVKAIREQSFMEMRQK